MSGEDCYTLGLVTGEQAKNYEEWLRGEGNAKKVK